MQHIKLIKIVSFLFFLTLFSFEAEATLIESHITFDQDTLVIEKLDSNKKVIIQSGQKIKLWLDDSKLGKVEFLSLDQNSMIVLDNKMERTILLNDISKIKIDAQPIGRILGGVLIVVGVGGMIFGGISLIVGTIALMADEIGFIILVAVPVLGLGGYGSYQAGRALNGKKLNLRSKWRISVNKE